MARTPGIDTALDKLTLNVSPGRRGRLHEGGFVSDDIVALSKANGYGKEDGAASEGGGERHHDLYFTKRRRKRGR